MRNFQKKRGWRNIFESKPVLVLLVILLFAFAWSIAGFMSKMKQTSENRKLAEQKLSKLESDKAQLSANIAKLNTEDGVEASIRDKYGYVKEGEELIVIVDAKEDEEKDANSSSGSFFSSLFFWKNWFK